VRQPIAGMAEAALNLLTARMTDESAAIRRVVCAPELVIRQSCVAPAYSSPGPSSTASVLR
jgi:LacI family transcriptional regulator